MNRIHRGRHSLFAIILNIERESMTIASCVTLQLYGARGIWMTTINKKLNFAKFTILIFIHFTVIFPKSNLFFIFSFFTTPNSEILWIFDSSTSLAYFLQFCIFFFMYFYPMFFSFQVLFFLKL